MINVLLKTTAASLLASTMAFAQVGAEIHGVKGDHEKTFLKVLEAMEEKGYVLSDPHERINDAYKTKYGSTKLDNLGFFSTAHDEVLRELLERHPKLGGFSPFNMHIWKKTGEDMTWYGHLNPEVMADIVGLKEAKDRKTFVDSFKDLDALAKSMMNPTTTNKIEFDKLPANTMMEFEVAIEGDLSDFADEFQGKYEEAFEKAGYIIAGYKNFKEGYTDAGKAFNYDAYWVYSLCHFPFSNGVFNDRPDAGIFAPCSVYMYVDKGGKTLKIGMPTLENWIAVNGIKNDAYVKSIRAIDAEIIKVMTTTLGAKKVN